MTAVPNYPDTGELIGFGHRVLVEESTGDGGRRALLGYVVGMSIPIGAEPAKYRGCHQILVEVEPDGGGRFHISPDRLTRYRPPVDVKLSGADAETILAWLADWLEQPDDAWDAGWSVRLAEDQRDAFRNLAAGLRPQ